MKNEESDSQLKNQKQIHTGPNFIKSVKLSKHLFRFTVLNFVNLSLWKMKASVDHFFKKKINKTTGYYFYFEDINFVLDQLVVFNPEMW